MKKVILWNFIILVVLISILELISYYCIKWDTRVYIRNHNRDAKINNVPELTLGYAPVKILNQKDYEKYRHTNIGSSKKSPILFFGCSYMWGSYLDEKETLPYIIYKKTKRTTVNRGIPGGCIFNMIYDLKNDNFYRELEKDNIKNPEFIVYMYINDHLNRISNPYYSSVKDKVRGAYYQIRTRYYIKDDKLVEYAPNNFILSFYTLYIKKAWHFIYANRFYPDTSDKRMYKLFKATKEITDKRFPNSKFVIIQYNDGSHVLMNEYMYDNLKKDGFIILNAEDLAGHELDSLQWRGVDKDHPSAKAINDVAMGLIKQLNL